MLHRYRTSSALLLRALTPYKPTSCSDLEEDPLFGDDVSPESRLSGSDWLGSSPPVSPDHSRCDGKTEVHKIVNRCGRFPACKAACSAGPR